ncbi:hypothetical protein M0805_008507 [Coniferiporia weirii]|nr:hypothetical protein M0805_008507 [Coniferiporia weirii]
MIRADAFPPDVWEAICTPMHEIVPASGRAGALFLGSWTAAVDADLLARHAVRAIVECHDAPWGACESGPAPPASTSAPMSMQMPAFTRSPTSIPHHASVLALARPQLVRSVSSSGVQIQTMSGMSHQNQQQVGRFKVALADSAAPDLLAPHLDGAVRFIRERLNRGENVLVHCQQGISRSPAIVLAFLMRERALSYDAALQVVKTRRKCIKPNEGFERTLRNWK